MERGGPERRRERPAREREPGRGDGHERPAAMNAVSAARQAGRCVHEMTGRRPEAVTAVEHTDDGHWRVDVQVVETRRIPDSTDVLAIYQVELDADGELLSYRRTRRYSRCQVEGV